MARSPKAQDPSSRARPARSTEVVRELILNAARECFADTGFTGTSTRQIAARADVVENLIYKHFGNKANLFDEAVAEPFRRAIDEFVQQWTPRWSSGPHSGYETARDYIEKVYDVLEGHAELLLAVLRDQRDNKPLLPLMQELERVAAYETGSQGYDGVDIVVLTRLQFAVVAFSAAFDDSLYPSDARRPSRQRIIDEMVAFFIDGTAHRTPNN
jgi:AcrR family transcriptional regulator